MASVKPAKPAETPATNRATLLADVGGRLLSVAWRHPMQTAIVFGIVLLPVVPIVAVQIALLRNLPEQPPKPLLDEAFEALDRHDFEEAAKLAQRLGAEQPMTADELKAKPFLLGVATDHQAAGMLGRPQRRLRALAAKYLEEARLLGFPPGREALGLFLLGKDLYESGQSAESVAILLMALGANEKSAAVVGQAAGPSGRERRPGGPPHDTLSDLHHLLAAAYFTQPQPNLHEALRHNAAYLSDKHLPAEAREAALIERSRIELALEDYAACEKTLDALAADSASLPQVAVLRALMWEHEAQAISGGRQISAHKQALEKIKDAIDLLEKVPSQPELETAADLGYLLGRLRLEMDDEEAGLALLRRAHLRWPETEAGFAAAFLTAERHRAKRRLPEAMSAYQAALKGIDAEAPFQNRWLSADELRTSLLDAYQEFLRRQQFEFAIELAKLSGPVLSAARSLQLQAQAHALWGRHLIATADAGGAPDADKRQSEGRRRLRQAGQLFRQLAELRAASREYPDDLYDAAEADLAGHDYSSAVETFKKYLEAEARKRRPRALLALGEALLALGQPAAALASLEECIEFHARDAAVFEARVMAARAYLQQGRTEPAEKLLLDNLYGDALSPASTEWRQSLLLLGRLLYEAGRYPEAIERLDEAIARYPQDAAAEESRYLAAESYRRCASQVRSQEAQEATAEGRLARRRQWTQLLENGLGRFEQELNGILLRQEQRPLSRLEESILRNCFFARGATLFSLGRYEEAIQAYASVTNRYQQRPEVLEAYMQIAACYRRLGQESDARSTLEQAKYALKHLPEGASFDDTSNYSRQEWARLFDGMGAL
ncbi:MAG TPA: tetratricopeptide repeat protein [Pirellulales bacterium]